MSSKVNSLENRIEEYFNFANLMCSCCNKLSEDAAELGIETLEQWEDGMRARLSWLIENQVFVRLSLARLRRTWPSSCTALENILDRYPMG